ncbi:unnamed protein product [Vicia faba]|uniref:Uncharacterized protein n=1 Tax=Vicia faba TaxID=3906 RepID=A0AAV1A0Z1_VICFA|nr:unnamed protein product [Vicia faba]
MKIEKSYLPKALRRLFDAIRMSVIELSKIRYESPVNEGIMFGAYVQKDDDARDVDEEDWKKVEEDSRRKTMVIKVQRFQRRKRAGFDNGVADLRPTGWSKGVLAAAGFPDEKPCSCSSAI